MTTEEYNIRERKIQDINKWIEGYQVTTHHENGKTVLALYKTAASKNDIPEFIKNLVSGTNKEVNIFINGMHNALNIKG